MTSNNVRISELIAQQFDNAHEAVRLHKYTHYRLNGGRGSTKSSFISIELILLILRNPLCHAVVFRKVADTLRTSVYAQCVWAISMLNLEDKFRCTVSPMEITYKPTGQRIMFRGADEPEKIKSIKPPFGYIGVTWFEELDQFAGDAEIRKILQSTMRGGERFWNFESFNPPITQANWVNRDSLTARPDRLIHSSCYLEVPKVWLGQAFFDEAEQLRVVNERAYRHEYLGEVTGTGGMVFENVVVRPITDEELNNFDRQYFGVDFGYFPDPWAFVKCHYSSGKRVLYIFDEAYGLKKSNRQTADILHSMCPAKDIPIICDSAEPKSIADYLEYGLYARGAEKGPGSVSYSMKWLQSLNGIVIDSTRCPHSAREFLEYEYERDKDGEVITGYPDKDNHFIDATRYALNLVWRQRGL